jgi:hypothetical protein
MTIAMIPNAMMVDRSSDFRCLLIVLDVVLNTKIVIVSVLICLDVRKGLVGFFAVHVCLRIHTIGLAIVKYGVALFDCFTSLGTIAFESGSNESSHDFYLFK